MAKAKRAFDLSEFAASLGGDVSKLDTSAPAVTLIDVDDILDNQANFYAVDKDSLTALVNSIAMDGLQQYPVVMPHPSKEGKYRLISGHRRCAAIRLLVEEGREDLRQVPCTVRSYASPAMAELALIVGNSTARTLTAAEISRQAERMTELLYQLKEEGYEFPGRMRDIVAQACQVSAPKLARLKVIREKLYRDWQYWFERNHLPEQTAYALARFPAEFQERLAQVFKEPPSGMAVERLLERYNKGWRWEPDLTCPDGKRCKRGDSFLRHDGDHIWDMCGGQTCCLECSQTKTACYPCDRMCSKAKAARAAKRDEDKAAVDALRRKNSDKYKSETSANAQRLVSLLEAAHMGDGETISWRSYRSPIKVSAVLAWAKGEFDPEEIWTEPELVPEQGDSRNLAELSKRLGCSTDYLLGLTVWPDPIQTVCDPASIDAAEQALEQAETPPQLLRWLPISELPAYWQSIVARMDRDRYLAMAGLWDGEALYDFVGEERLAVAEDILEWMPIPGENDVYMLLPKEGE